MCKDMCGVLESLADFLETKFTDVGTIKTTGDTLYKLQPEPYGKVYPTEPEDIDLRFTEYQQNLKELNESIDAANKAYNSYRIAIRNTLFL